MVKVEKFIPQDILKLREAGEELKLKHEDFKNEIWRSALYVCDTKQRSCVCGTTGMIKLLRFIGRQKRN